MQREKFRVDSITYFKVIHTKIALRINIVLIHFWKKAATKKRWSLSKIVFFLDVILSLYIFLPAINNFCRFKKAMCKHEDTITRNWFIMASL